MILSLLLGVTRVLQLAVRAIEHASLRSRVHVKTLCILKFHFSGRSMCGDTLSDTIARFISEIQHLLKFWCASEDGWDLAGTCLFLGHWVHIWFLSSRVCCTHTSLVLRSMSRIMRCSGNDFRISLRLIYGLYFVICITSDVKISRP